MHVCIDVYYIYIYICIYTCMYIYIYIYTDIYIYIVRSPKLRRALIVVWGPGKSIKPSVPVYVCMQGCIHASMVACLFACLSVCHLSLCACVYVGICVCACTYVCNTCAGKYVCMRARKCSFVLKAMLPNPRGWML